MMSRSYRRPLFGLVPLAALILQTASAWGQIPVPGTSDPWLAGMPNGSTASINDSAPGQSPVLVSGIPIVPGTFLTFSTTGSVSNTAGPSGLTPDGGSFLAHATGAENGISDANIPISSLVGVFLDGSQPDSSAAPNALDFTGMGGLDFASLSPGLKQVFFIGDGLTSGNVVQQFVVPAGATRLYLGVMDGYEWNNNFGTFGVTVGSSAVPEPSVLILGGALAGAGMTWRLRRKSSRRA